MKKIIEICLYHVMLLFILSGCGQSSNKIKKESNVNTSPPELIDVTGTPETYGPGALIVLATTFNKDVTVSQDATLTLDVGGITESATLSSDGSVFSLTHEFTYTVGDSLSDSDGIDVTGFTGTIQDGDSNDLSALAQNISLSDVLVDNISRPPSYGISSVR